MNVLGIETSCDETSVAILQDDKVKANLISSQDFHSTYGGVVPELSSRAHLQLLLPLIKQALKSSALKLDEIDIITATSGPGLIGALLVGLTTAKGISYSINKPLIPVNHIEGHIFSGFLMPEKPVYPYLCLVVSGGHTLLLIVENDLMIKKLGSTIDDAAGEAFDKVAKMLGLIYPGGPSIQNYALKGNNCAIEFPVARTQNEYDFSFSGLKTSVLRFIKENYNNCRLQESDLPDICASFQKAVIKALTDKVNLALNKYDLKSISLVGGVAANLSLRGEMKNISTTKNIKLIIPGNEYCGDNAAMIAQRGKMLFLKNQNYTLEANAFAALPHDAFN